MRKEFTEYEVEEMNVKLENGDTYIETGCIGTSEETFNTKTISKKCKGIVTKQRTRHAGGGEVKITGHILYSAYCKMHGMENSDLKDGIMSYGSGIHPTMCVTLKVRDEDNILKLKAYPNAVVSTGPSRKIDATSEEVAEVEMTLALSNDEFGQCEYEKIIEDEKTEEAFITSWMTSFSHDLVKKAAS